MAWHAAQVAASSPAVRITRRTGAPLNDVDKGKRVAHYFKKGEKGTNAAGWCKGMIVEVLTSGNLRIKYEDGIRLAIPKAKVLELIMAKLFKML